jgi:hypothetical protein
MWRGGSDHPILGQVLPVELAPRVTSQWWKTEMMAAEVILCPMAIRGRQRKREC